MDLKPIETTHRIWAREKNKKTKNTPRCLAQKTEPCQDAIFAEGVHAHEKQSPVRPVNFSEIRNSSHKHVGILKHPLKPDKAANGKSQERTHQRNGEHILKNSIGTSNETSSFVIFQSGRY